MRQRALTTLLTLAAVAAAVVAAATVARSDGADDSLHAVRDAEGYFRLDGDAPAEAYAGDGVRALVGNVGRVDPDAQEAFVFVRAADGGVERRALRTTSTQESQQPAFVAAASSWVRARAEYDPVNWEPPPPALSARSSSAPTSVPEPGADVAQWGLAGMPIVRFRSTEAAFRFADVADRIAARLLALEGDGRDYGTLRWALHDLLLPATWSANPEGARGAGACAVMFDGIPWRGRTRLAAVLRITDPELHRMETAAGVGYAALPAHLWAPEDDPAPESRARRNHRRVVGDVEIIATDEDLLDAVATRRGASNVHREWRAAAGEQPPPESEAVLALVPSSARAVAASQAAQRFDAFERALREVQGWRHVWRGWSGVQADEELRLPLTAPGPGPSALSSAVSMRVLTDAKGADVEVVFADAVAARAAAEILARAAEPFIGAADLCARNRRQVSALATVDRARDRVDRARDGAGGDFAERCFVVLGWKPVCPCGGTYQVHPITRAVTCSAHGSDARPVADVKPPKPVLRNVSTDGATVRFHVPIDWR